MAEFFQMGGYAFYVWSSYLIVLVLFIYQYFSPIFQHRKLFSELDQEIESRSSPQTHL